MQVAGIKGFFNSGKVFAKDHYTYGPGTKLKRSFNMQLTTYCPNCKSLITSRRWEEQDWFFCSNCQSQFFSHESLRRNWPSLYRAIHQDEEDLPTSA